MIYYNTQTHTNACSFVLTEHQSVWTCAHTDTTDLITEVGAPTIARPTNMI